MARFHVQVLDSSDSLYLCKALLKLLNSEAVNFCLVFSGASNKVALVVVVADLGGRRNYLVEDSLFFT